AAFFRTALEFPGGGCAFDRVARVVREVDVSLSPCAGKVIAFVNSQDHQVILLEPSEKLGLCLGLAPHTQKPVALPVDIGELGDDVALNFRVHAQALNFIFERRILATLGRLEQGVGMIKKSGVLVLPKTLLPALRRSDLPVLD